ncbi:protein of unknown function [Methylorubrum extorquens]|uniref:Uncharacterized protein n=1 Tax=Methylorubrum extorquens TaxID=408 RepID=A0A2N9AN19_METEX|nr:protein of unknown function [Methylorubrum extorquens]
MGSLKRKGPARRVPAGLNFSLLGAREGYECPPRHHAPNPDLLRRKFRSTFLAARPS